MDILWSVEGVCRVEEECLDDAWMLMSTS